ncbi:hypothetical protein KIN20_032532 [Parelaphostrongylus tenuis]|uniref:Uncharacterized protein n=1 Tax=Parelaphostrongylus tenuis TaxID=148309 RepID=A0AAD5WIJ8_PARTN|nr:hypothetical protein KIN20_032532 [Parelaphostrongylus tenuis]
MVIIAKGSSTASNVSELKNLASSQNAFKKPAHPPTSFIYTLFLADSQNDRPYYYYRINDYNKQAVYGLDLDGELVRQRRRRRRRSHHNYMVSKEIC